MDCTSFGSQMVFDLGLQARARYANLISLHESANDKRALQAGVIAVAGLGLSPGLANILAQHASQAFDELHEYHIYWVSFRSPAPTRDDLDTMTWELANHCPERGYFLNGLWRPAGFMEGFRLVDFGGAIGEQRVYFVPHPEITDLLRSFPSLRYCSVRGTWQRELMEEFRILNDYGLLEADTLEQTKTQIWAQRGGQHQFPCSRRADRWTGAPSSVATPSEARKPGVKNP
jgi:saccharopine dehydrogenase-like NADP-dependent oxidoreductase